MSAHSELTAPYVGGDAPKLGFSLTVPPQEALAQRDHTIAGLVISLRVLASSHQVIIGDGARQLCETVTSNVTGPDTSLPESFQDDDYYFSSSVEERSAEEIKTLVEEVGARVGEFAESGRPALMARYPDEPLTVTALIAEADDEVLRWRTWHTFPGSGEVVETASSVRLGSG